MIEKDIFKDSKTDVNVLLQKFGVHISMYHLNFLDKYHASLALKSNSALKLAFKM